VKPQTDPRLDAYIAQSGEFARSVLRHLRALIHEACPAVEETMKWSHPSFVLDGKILCGIAAFKAHCTFGFWHQEMQKLLDRELGKAGDAAGLLGRITSVGDMPDDATMRRYIKRAAALTGSSAPARPAPKPKAALAVPADLAAALKKNKAAGTAFENFSPSHRREYIEWITEAKREETRQSRLTTALEWIAAGKPRNWKYAAC
jgi:uncharacterized protein YdeI (YjbR/CyaY-like superfamily)